MKNFGTKQNRSVTRLCYPSSVVMLVLCTLAASSLGGGGPQNVLVVVNAADPNSVALGEYYAKRRNIPPINMCTLNLRNPSFNISARVFEEEIRRPIFEYLQSEHLLDQIHYLVLCWRSPTRVNKIESITGALHDGFKNAPEAPPCVPPTNYISPYFRAEKAFRNNLFGADRKFLVTILSAPTLALAKELVDRSVAADGTRPSGTFYLMDNELDPARNTRYRQYVEFETHARNWPGFPAWKVLSGHTVTGVDDILGYMVGMSGYATFWGRNRYRWGAICDHMTSLAADLPEPAHGQSSVWDWIRDGASATYGTVSEPCNFVEKFPSPMVFFWYARGFNLAESYWMSVAAPYQGLFVGDPLMAPFATPPQVTIEGITNGQIITEPVTALVTAVGTDHSPIAKIDLFVDDRFATNLVTIRPSPWNRVILEVEGAKYSYVIGRNDSLYDVAGGIARAVRSANPILNATAWGDRVVLLDGRIGKPGTATPVRVAVDQGLGKLPTVRARTLGDTFVEGPYKARQTLFVTDGKANEGDRLELDVRLVDGMSNRITIVALAGETASSVVARLARALDEDPVLGSERGVRITHAGRVGTLWQFLLEARSPGPEGMGIEIRYSIRQNQPGAGLSPPVSYRGRLMETVDALCPRAVVVFACGSETLTTSVTLSPEWLGKGKHQLRFVAYDGTAVETQGQALLALEVP